MRWKLEIFERQGPAAIQKGTFIIRGLGLEWRKKVLMDLTADWKSVKHLFYLEVWGLFCFASSTFCEGRSHKKDAKSG